ncbi:MAG: PAS domain S-box protein [Syntrophales bacterium]
MDRFIQNPQAVTLEFEDLYKLMHLNSLVGFYVVQNGKFKVMNKNFRAYIGFSEENLMRRDPLSIVHPEDRAMVRQKAIQMLKARLSLPYEFRVITPAGELVWLIETVSSIIYKGHRASLGINMNITTQKNTEETLRKSEERFRTIIETMEDGYAETDRNGNITFVNKALSRQYGHSRDELIGKNLRKYLDPEYVPHVFQSLAEISKTGNAVSGLQTKAIHKNGTKRYTESSVSLIKNAKGQPTGFRSIVRDITDRRAAEETLRKSEERFRTIVETMGESYAETDIDGKITFVNEAKLRLTGHRRDELIGKRLDTHIDPEDIPSLSKILTEILQTGNAVSDIPLTCIRKDGTKRHTETSISMIKDTNGQPAGFRGIMHDITDRKMAEDTIKQLAYHDALTGLPNRLLLRDRLDMAIVHAERNKKKLAMMMLDLDKFKDVNDTLGHQMGDLLLRAVAHRLTGLFRQGDTVSRLGGDEFVVLLPEITGAEDTAAIAEKIIASFQEPSQCNGSEISITTSIGIAIFPEHGKDKDTLLKHADIAMYRAKETGRNNYHIIRLQETYPQKDVPNP